MFVLNVTNMFLYSGMHRRKMSDNSNICYNIFLPALMRFLSTQRSGFLHFSFTSHHLNEGPLSSRHLMTCHNFQSHVLPDLLHIPTFDQVPPNNKRIAPHQKSAFVKTRQPCELPIKSDIIFPSSREGGI